jgi:hypothetical protein
VVTLVTPKASPTSPTLEGETTLETFLPMQRRWLTAGAATPTNLYPILLLTKSINNNIREAFAGHC